MSLSSRFGGYLAAGVPVLALTLASCGAPLHVQSYSERGFDAAKYRTYAWAPSDHLVTGDPRLDNNQIFLDRLRTDVDRALVAKGYERKASGRPDIVVHYHVRMDQKVEADDLDRSRGYTSDREPYVYDAGTLLFDIVDARTNKLVWRGWSEGTMDGAIDNQRLMEERVDQAVSKIFATLRSRS